MREKLIQSDLQKIRRLVYRCMDSSNVPGMAVGIVAGDKILLARGYGLADQRRVTPVTKDTLFPIGSCTKAFTATALGILVDEGIIGFNKPVRRYLPSLRMNDPAVTKRLTIGDLLSHRSGLPNYFGARPSRERSELLEMLAHLPLARGFRHRFLYSNKGYILAGLVLEKLAGMAWEDYVRLKLFGPLNMRGSGFTSEILEAGQNELNGHLLATGYTKQGNRVLPWQRGWSKKLSLASLLRAIGPDSTILSTAQDMCQWIALQLDADRLKDQIITA
jgi:CubicO group peptidase (beta-lactamase class C family)